MGAEAAPGAAPGRPASGPLFWRVVAVLPLLVGGILWTHHHLGAGPGWLTALVASVSGAIKGLDYLLEKTDTESFLRQIRDWLRRLLAPGLLAAAYLVAAGFALTRSTVVVALAPSEAAAKVTLTPLDHADSVRPTPPVDGGALVRLHLWTTPLGRPVRLAVEGYVPETLDVYPLVGRTIRPDRDLRRAPSVLLRLPVVAQRIMKEGGELLVWTRIDPPRALVARVTGSHGAYLIGRSQPLPPQSLADWRLELQAAGAKDDEIPPMLVSWYRPQVVRPETALEPETTLVAEVRSAAQKVAARVETSLGSRSWVDVEMEESR